MLSLRNNRLAAYDNLLHSCARQRKDNRRQEIVSRGAGDRWIIEIDSKEIRWSSSLERTTWRSRAARTVHRRAIKQQLRFIARVALARARASDTEHRSLELLQT